jgi:predicted O-methyltransferase YrrM
MLEKITKLLPKSVINFIRIFRDNFELSNLPVSRISTNQLASYQDVEFIKNTMNDERFHQKWTNIKNELEALELPENTGGVNSGDQRAIAYLIWKYNPCSVLEIGTHIGCSTVHIAAALRELKDKDHKIITVDIRDVNDTYKKPWVFYKSPMSPKSLIEKVNYSENVEFVVKPSVDYLKEADRKFDFIFLDGGHSASLVYKELPLASKLLSDNGIILLHDYFPNNKAIWDNNSIIPGPFLATERFIKEGNNIRITPLGELPWKTKRNSKYTSLAICYKSI